MVKVMLLIIIRISNLEHGLQTGVWGLQGSVLLSLKILIV